MPDEPRMEPDDRFYFVVGMLILGALVFGK